MGADMASVEFSIHLDTTKMDGFKEFMTAAVDLDRLFDATDAVSAAKLPAAVDRWRIALRGLKGGMRVELAQGGRLRRTEVGRISFQSAKDAR